MANTLVMRPAEEIERSQQELSPSPEDLAPYAGKWVAIRDGRVVADAPSLRALRALPDVSADDIAVPVAEAGAGAFIL